MVASPHASQTDAADFLSRWPWFAALAPEHRRLLVDTIVERKTVAGEYIARANEPCLHWYGIVKGLLQMYGAADLPLVFRAIHSWRTARLGMG